MDIFYYALFSWRASPDTRSGYQAFSYAEASGYSLISTLLIVVLILEGIPVHWVLLRANHLATWLVTGVEIYALLWAIALMRAVALRPILVGEQSVVLRAGFLWQLEIPRDNIVTVRRVSGPAGNRRQPGYLAMVGINEPQLAIDLRDPAIAHGVFGIHRSISHILLAVDQPEPFIAALAIKPAS